MRYIHYIKHKSLYPIKKVVQRIILKSAILTDFHSRPLQFNYLSYKLFLEKYSVTLQKKKVEKKSTLASYVRKWFRKHPENYDFQNAFDKKWQKRCMEFNLSSLFSHIKAVGITLRVFLEGIICYSHTFDNDFWIKRKFTKYLKESCCLAADQHFSFKCFQENAFVNKIFPKSSGLFWV